MFSRAAKSVVKSFGQRKYYAGEDNLKITLIGTIEGVNLNASRLARQHSTLNTIPIYDVAGINKGFLFIQNRMRHFNGAEPFCGQNSRMLTLMEKSRSYETTSKQDTMMKDNSRLPYLTDQLKVNETDINKLVEALHCLPIGEEARAVNQHFTSPKAGDTCTSKLRSMMTRILDEMGHNNTTRRVRQKNDILSEMTEWLLRPIDPYGEIANATTFSTSSTRKEKKLTKKTISKRCHKKKVRKLPIVASVVKITPFKKSEDKFSTLHLMNKKKLKIHMDKCVKRNNDKEQRKDEERLYKTNVKNKLKDWTVPAAFTNKKSRLLYNFSKANDKARSSWFLSKVLDGRNIQNDDSIKLKRFIATSAKAKPRLYDIIKDDKKCNTDSEKISTEDEKLINLKSKSLSQIVPLNHVTLSMEDLKDLSGAFISDFYTRIEKCKFQEEPLERSLMEVQMISEDVDHLSDENERLSSFFQRKETENNFCKKWRPVERVSSAVRSLLENVRRKKIIKKSNSSLSVDSYHLDDFFKLRPSSADLTTNLFSDVNEEVLNDWLERNLYSSCNKIPQDPCTCLKKRQGLGGKHDSCKKNPCAKPDPCKKDPCAKPDPCKKDPCAKPDPCKKDPCAKPDPCKKDPCAKPDPCKKDPCAKPDPCKKDPCKKPDPCKKDPCKKPDPCPKPDPCKKSDPCPKPDPCKKPDPCPKPDPCKKPDPCSKPDPCKKPDPCPKLDPCKKKKTSCATLDSCPKRNSCTSEKVDCPEMKKTDDTCVQKQCPPVIRAPGCPNNTKGGDKKCRTPSIYYFKDEFLYEKLFKKKYLKFLFPDKNMLTKEIDIIKKSNVKRIKTNMELPKLYTLDTFGINYNIED